MENLRLFQILRMGKLVPKSPSKFHFYLYLKKGGIKDVIFDGRAFYKIIENGCG